MHWWSFYKLTKTPADKKCKMLPKVQIRCILVLTRMRASRLKTKLKSGLCHPHPRLASWGPMLGKAWWVMFWTFSHHLHHRWHHCHHRHHHICHHGHRGVCFTDCCAETNSSRLNISTLPDSTLEPIYEIGKPWFGILRLAQPVAKPPSLTHCCHKKRCRNIE